MELSGLTALITGAGSKNGIGFSIAEALKTVGAEVVLTSRSERVLERGKEIRALALAADLTQENEVQSLISQATTHLGRLDILVNNAGMTSITDPATNETNSVSDLTFEDWQKSLSRNLSSAFLTTKYALPYLRKSSNGRIIFIASTSGPLQATANDAAYATSKAALVGLTRALAIDEAPITVNAIAPGWIATESQTPHEAHQGRATLLGRSGTPEEVASAVTWLASPKAAFTTGQMIVIDGGNSILEERA